MFDREAHPKHPKAYIFKQKGSKNWTVEFVNSHGKRTRKSARTTDKQQAFNYLDELIILQSHAKRGTVIITDNNTPTVRRVVNEVIKQIEAKSPDGIRDIDKRYIQKMNLFADQFGSYQIDRITDDHFYKYLNNNYARTTLRYMFTALNRIFRLAFKRNYIDKMPDIPRDIQRKEPQYVLGLTDEQLKAFFTRLSERYSMLLATTYNMDVPRHRKSTLIELKNAELLMLFADVMLRTGARNKELETLFVADVLAEKVKDETRHFLKINSSKTKPRKILIMPDLYHQISDYIHENNLNENTPLFYNQYSGLVPCFSQVLQSDRENNQARYDQLGIGSVTLYQLRHTYITDNLRQRRNIVFIAQYCGTSVKMIEKHYADEIHSLDYSYMHNPAEVAIYNDQHDDDYDQRV